MNALIAAAGLVKVYSGKRVVGAQQRAIDEAISITGVRYREVRE